MKDEFAFEFDALDKQLKIIHEEIEDDIEKEQIRLEVVEDFKRSQIEDFQSASMFEKFCQLIEKFDGVVDTLAEKFYYFQEINKKSYKSTVARNAMQQIVIVGQSILWTFLVIFFVFIFWMFSSDGTAQQWANGIPIGECYTPCHNVVDHYHKRYHSIGRNARTPFVIYTKDICLEGICYESVLGASGIVSGTQYAYAEDALNKIKESDVSISVSQDGGFEVNGSSSYPAWMKNYILDESHFDFRIDFVKTDCTVFCTCSYRHNSIL